MPIYICRWTNPVPAVCLVRAASKKEALILMDWISDPACCEIKEYRGTLFIEIDFDMKYHEKDVPGSSVPHTVIDDVSKCLGPESCFDVRMQTEMEIDLQEAAFPHYDKYYGDYGDDEHISERKRRQLCKKAIQQDFDHMERVIRNKLEPPPKRTYAGGGFPKSEL